VRGSICCQDLFQDVRNPIRSPFTRMISLGWFDGSTDGVVQCGTCGTPYKFSILAIDDGSYDFDSWNKGRDLIVYGLAELSENDFDKIVAILAVTEPPRWPEWYRGPYVDYQNKQEYLRVDGEVIEYLERSNNISLAIACRMGDLLKEIRSSRRVTKEDLDRISGHQWLDFLGFSQPDSP